MMVVLRRWKNAKHYVPGMESITIDDYGYDYMSFLFIDYDYDYSSL